MINKIIYSISIFIYKFLYHKKQTIQNKYIFQRFYFFEFIINEDLLLESLPTKSFENFLFK